MTRLLSKDSNDPAPSGSNQIYFALTANEQSLFFPAGLGAITPLSERTDIDAIPRDQWAQFLEDRKPRIIVSGWSTPQIPRSLTVAGGGPIEYVCHTAGSVRRIVEREAISGGLQLTNWGSLVGPLVAEHALLLVLAQARNLPAWRGFIAQPPRTRSPSSIETRTLFRKRVAIHGFGAIARAFIRLLAPFDADLRVFSQGVDPATIEQHGVQSAASLSDLCDHAQVFVCCEALTPATRGCLNAEMINRFAPGSIFVNVARGAIVDEAALLAAIPRLGLRVASDVFISEPISENLPFLAAPSTLVSPHIGGPTHDFYGICGDYALANIERFRRGEELQSRVTPEIFDRST